MVYSKKMAGIVLAALAALMSLAIGAQSVTATGADEQAAAADRGQKIFAANCSFCHGTQARGGEGGPNLLRSVLVTDDVGGDKIGQVVLNGRPDEGMPKFAMTPTQISDIASFLHRSIQAAAERNDYKILNTVTGDPRAGEIYFNGAGRCNTCHSVTGDLNGIGAKYDPVTLQDLIVMPRGGRRHRRGHAAPAIPGTARTVIVTLPSGTSFQGELEHIDDFNVALLDSGGEYHSFARNGDVPAVEVRDPLQAHYELLTKYTDADMHNLTAYLVTLK